MGDNPLNGTDPTGLICFSMHCITHDVASAAGDVVVATAAVAVTSVVVAAAVTAGPEILVAGGVYVVAADVSADLLAGAAMAGIAFGGIRSSNRRRLL